MNKTKFAVDMSITNDDSEYKDVSVYISGDSGKEYKRLVSLDKQNNRIFTSSDWLCAEDTDASFDDIISSDVPGEIVAEFERTIPHAEAMLHTE